jgi:cytochrome b pre-mRNA-processing protein 3
MFATGSDKHKHAKNRELDQTAGTAVPPVSPLSLKGQPHTTGLNADSSEIPKAFRFMPLALTRPYTQYGLTEILYEACRTPAEYSIPQAADPEAEVPKTDDGEDLGVGTGWWYEGTNEHFCPAARSSLDILFSNT